MTRRTSNIAISAGWNLVGGSLTERALLTLWSLLAMTAMYWGYSLVISPMVKAPSIRHARVMSDEELPATGVARSREMAERYLAHQPWAADAKYQIRTSDAYVYFRKWQPVETDERVVRFEPFAVIWLGKNGREDETPITMASDSSYITFTEKFSISDLNAGPIISGGLEGDVRITGPRGLAVSGRNFVFADEAKRIWSDDTVDFAYEMNRGSALGLQVELIPAERAEGDTRPAVSGIKSIRLRRNVAMDFISAGSESLFGNDRARDNRRKSKEPDVLQVRSDGSFEYVLATNTATFDDNVRIFHPTGPGQSDTLQSDDKVVLKFERKEKPAPSAIVPVNGTAPAPADGGAPNGGPQGEAANSSGSPGQAGSAAKEEFRTFDSGLEFRRLHARGKTVILTSQSNKLWSRMNEFKYDRETSTAVLSSTSGSPNGGPGQVMVKQGSSDMRSPEITLVHDKDGTITHALCRGAGRLDNYDEKTGRNLELSAEWKKELRKFPDTQSPFDVIELEEQALVQQPEQRWGLAAERIRIWMDPVRREKKEPKQRGTAASGSSRLRLRYMLATQNVALVNPEMQAQTEQLQVWFEERRAGAGTTIGRAAGRSRENLLLTSGRRGFLSTAAEPPLARGTGEALYGPLAAADGVTQTFATTSEVAHDDGLPQPLTESTRGENQNRSLTGDLSRRPDDGPIEVASDLIQVRVIQGPARNQSEVAEIWTKGNVRVKQEHGAGEEPFRMFGDRMHVENRTETEKVLHVYGRPAHIHDRGVHIEGHDIRFDRAGNDARVDGAGRLQLPVTQSFDGRPLARPRPLDIYWVEQMTFDGLTARFFGDVQGAMNDDTMVNRMRCQEMQVVLTEKVRFSGPPRRQEVRLRNVLCEGGVEFDSDESAGGKRIDIRRMTGARFSLDQVTGAIQGQGPGTITRWQYGQGRPSGLGPISNVRANSPLKPNAAEWTYTRVRFAGRMSGNMNQRSSTFHDDVDILYGPVAKESDTIDRNRLGEESGWLGCNVLTVTQHPETPTSPAYAELLAEGNARLEGQTYNGRADSISYDGSKGLFVLRAEGNGTATIWRQKQLGSSYSQNDAQQMEFIPRSNKLKLNQVTGLNAVE